MAKRPNFRSLDYMEMNEEERSRIDDECFLWEAYYDLVGVKPRHIGISLMTDEELQAAIESISRELDERTAHLEEQRKSLAAARAHPRGIIALSAYGAMCAEDGETIDPDDLEMWDWYIQPEPPANNPFATLLKN